MASVAIQTWALIRRYLVVISRWPISSLIRILLFPGLLLGLMIWILGRTEDSSSEFSRPLLASIVPTMMWFSTTFHVWHFLQWLVTDKTTGMKSLMISMGLRRSSYYLANSISIIGTMLPTTLALGIVSLIYILFDSQTSTFLVILIFILFCVQITGIIIALTTFITANGFVMVAYSLFILDLLLHLGVVWLVEEAGKSWQPLILFVSCLSPYESIRIFFNGYQLCKNCDEILWEGKLVSQPSYLIAIAMSFWSVLAFAFARWFDEVCPWQIDSAVKGPLFCFGDKSGYETHPDTGVEDFPRGSRYYEPSPANRDIGIRVNKVTKTYRNIPVVNDLSFNIYRGETTLLLGHNGAGKTTLMDIILHKLSPNSGGVSINNHYSNHNNLSIGVCPQSSVLDDNLDIWQHLELFADIKSSMSAQERANHIKTTIDDVSLASHSSKLPPELSGGMKRKLSLAMALVGNSNILVLDEPSSGLDPDSRIFIWNAIRRFRTDRTVLLSTQHMEEADYLGDRIAIMSAGRIVCCGSSTFLNQAFGTGYKLRIECRLSKMSEVMQFIRKYFKEAEPSTQQGDGPQVGKSSPRTDPIQDILIELKDKTSQDLELNLINMLEEIETDSAAKHILSHGLKSPSLEDVMLTTDKQFSHEPKESVRLNLTNTATLVASLANPSRRQTSSFMEKQILFLQAFLAKHVQTYKNDWKSLIMFRLLFPLLALWTMTDDMNDLIALPRYKVNFFNFMLILHFIYYPAQENASKFKTMQLTSYANHVIYWLSQIIIDLVTVVFIAIGLNIFVATLFKGEFVSPRISVHLLLTVAIILGCIASAILAYVISTCITNSNSAMGYHLMVYMIGPSISLLIIIIELATSKDLGWLRTGSDYLIVTLLPLNALEYVVYGLASKCYVKVPTLDCRASGGISPVNYGLIALLFQIIAYSAILYVLESRNLQLSWYFNYKNVMCCLVRRQPIIQSELRVVDSDVVEESTKALQLIKHVPRTEYSLVAADLNKSYIKGVSVIDHLSFTVNKGECFGLLGVNGAGKSTTFSMLAAETKPDKGKIWLGGGYNYENVNIYRQKLGYDPQSNPEMSISMTDALYLMARLRRVNQRLIPKMVSAVLELFEMTEHSMKRVCDLSGGTKRKLALGMSLIGNPALLALDEPTAGVDPMARRSVWQLLKSLRTHNGASIVISSHAMEECEAICDRISIMARGKLRCIGTFLHLRSKFAKGCSVRVRYGTSSQSTTGHVMPVQVPVAQLTAELEHKLRAGIGEAVKLTDTNINSATFSIADNSAKRSTILKILREFKLEHPSMDYLLNDSSLEDIFISLAREQQQIEMQMQR